MRGSDCPNALNPGEKKDKEEIWRALMHVLFPASNVSRDTPHTHISNLRGSQDKETNGDVKRQKRRSWSGSLSPPGQ